VVVLSTVLAVFEESDFESSPKPESEPDAVLGILVRCLIFHLVG
jgi:hypothetical protein